MTQGWQPTMVVLDEVTEPTLGPDFSAFQTGHIIESYAGVDVVCDNRLGPMMMRVEHYVKGALGLVDPKPVYQLRVHLSNETWEAIAGHDEAETQFYEDLANKQDEWRDGPSVRYLVEDVGPYAGASKLAAERKRAQELDVLAQLAQEASALVAQAAELRSRPTASQAANFGQRYGELVERHADLKRRLDAIGSTLDFARVAIMDAVDLRADG